jgi:hypothetical protein
MNALVAYWDRETVIHPYICYEERGDVVDEISKRLGAVETDVSKLRVDVGIIASNYATKTDVAEIKTSMANLRTEFKEEIHGLRKELSGEIAVLSGGMTGLRGDLNARIESIESKMIRWFVATSLTALGLAIAAAKYLH